MSVCLSVCLVNESNKYQQFNFYFDKAKQKNVCSYYMKKYSTKIFCFCSVCLSVLLMNKTSTNSLIFYFDKAKQKNVCSDYMKKYSTKIFCFC